MPLKTILYPLDPNGYLMKVRRVTLDPGKNPLAAKCAWCRVQSLEPLCKVIREGITINLCQFAGYCKLCEKGTIVEYETKR